VICYDIKFEEDFHRTVKTDWNTNGIFDPEFMNKKMKYCSKDTIFGHGWGQPNRHFIYAYEGTKIVGVLKIKIKGEDSCGNPGFCNWVDYITVDPDYKNKGIATTLIKMMFEYLKEKGETHMLASGYSTFGFHFLRNKLNTLAKEYSINFKDEDTIGFPDRDQEKVIEELFGKAA